MWEIVIQRLQQYDLCALSLVSVALRTLSVGFLFREIHITAKNKSNEFCRILARLNEPKVCPYTQATYSGWDTTGVSHRLDLLSWRASTIFGLRTLETEAFIYALRQLRTLNLSDLHLNTDQYVTILFTSPIRRLVLQRVYLYGRPPKGPTKSQITDLELNWDANMATITNQLLSDLEKDLESYTLHLRAVELKAGDLIFPRSPHLKSFTIVYCRRERCDQDFFYPSLVSYIGGATSLVHLSVDTHLGTPLVHRRHTLPHILRLHLRPFDLCFGGDWIKGRQLVLLDLTKDCALFNTFLRTIDAVQSSASISELRLRVAWGLREAALRQLATRHLPVTRLTVHIDHPEVKTITASPLQDNSPWIGIEKVDFIVAWSGRFTDLENTKDFRRWVEELVGDERSRIRNASFDIWQSPVDVWRAFDHEKDEVQWWETWNGLSRCWECPGDRDLVRLSGKAIS